MENNHMCPCEAIAILYDKDKICCKNCLHEQFHRNNNSGSLQLVCIENNRDYRPGHNYYFSCPSFLRRSPAYVLSMGQTLVTPDGKVFHAKLPTYDE